tara:strand:+ start:2239 stop:2457 length:219 start_codon:yes stop_codon:yes gene_type:complete
MGTSLKINIAKGLISFKYKQEERGVLTSLILLWIINFTMGIHSLNGEHIIAGFGIGPLEVSLTLHRWNKWIP